MFRLRRRDHDADTDQFDDRFAGFRGDGTDKHRLADPDPGPDPNVDIDPQSDANDDASPVPDPDWNCLRERGYDTERRDQGEQERLGVPQSR